MESVTAAHQLFSSKIKLPAFQILIRPSEESGDQFRTRTSHEKASYQEDLRKMISDREFIFKFKLTSHRGVKILLVGAVCGYSLTKVDDPNDRKCEPDWKLLGLWKIHCPFLMAVYKKACKLNIRFCRSDLNFLPLLKLMLPKCYWNPLNFEEEGRTLQPGLSARRMLQTFWKDVKKNDGAFISKKKEKRHTQYRPTWILRMSCCSCTYTLGNISVIPCMLYDWRGGCGVMVTHS